MAHKIREHKLKVNAAQDAVRDNYIGLQMYVENAMYYGSIGKHEVANERWETGIRMHKAKFLKSEFTIGALLKEIETDVNEMEKRLKVLEEEKKRNDEIWKTYDDVDFGEIGGGVVGKEKEKQQGHKTEFQEEMKGEADISKIVGEENEDKQKVACKEQVEKQENNDDGKVNERKDDETPSKELIGKTRSRKRCLEFV